MKNKLFILLSVTVLTILLAISSSYALYRINITGNNDFRVVLGTLELEIKDTKTDDMISLDNMLPQKESEALNQEGYTFTLRNKGTLDSTYTINLEDVIPTGETKNRIEDSLMRANIYNSKTEKNYTFSLENNRIIETGVISGGESITYTLKLWLDENAGNDAQNKYFAVKIKAKGIQNNSQILLSDVIKEQNEIKTTTPNLTTVSSDSDTGLYKMAVTNGFGGTNGDTYYFRGNITNNYVSFAGYTWRIVRINEDGTVRLILDSGINNNSTYPFKQNANSIEHMYYTNSDVKNTVDNWYQDNIVKKGYDELVASGNYFCEQAKVAQDNGFKAGTNCDVALINNYTANLNCQSDNNGYGLVSSNVGLINIDEALFSGVSFSNNSSSNSYLLRNKIDWTMNTSGYASEYYVQPYGWAISNYNRLYFGMTDNMYVRPVINLKATTKVIGNGTSSDPYVVVMNSDNLNKSYIVTFDANGGSVSIPNKSVTYNSTYGDLPTPTRTGYTFKGWNGKNMFDVDNFIETFSPYYPNEPSKTTFQDFEVLKLYGGIISNGRSIKYMEGQFKENTSYTFYFDIYDVYFQCIGSRYCVGSIIAVNYTDGTHEDLNPFLASGYVSVSESWKEVKFTSDSNKTIDYVSVSYQYGQSYAYIKDFQIEEGTTATPYEPYYLTSSTKVTQNKNHTLKAIWEADS